MERIYRFSILIIAFILPSPFSGFSLAVLAVTFICWLRARDYKHIPFAIKRPEVFLPVALYFFMVAGLLYTEHTGKILSGLSTQLAFVLFPIIIGSSSIIDKELVKESGRLFTLSIRIFLLAAILYALFDTMFTGVNTKMVGESLHSKYKSFGLTSVFYGWHPTYVAMFANLGIAVQLQNCLKQYDKKSLFNSFITIFFLNICLVLLNSLIGLMAFVLLLLYYAFKVSRLLNFKSKTIFAIVFGICTVLFSLFYFNPFQNDKIDSLKNKEFIITDKQGERNLLTMRMAKWETHLGIFKDHWLAGTSFGDIQYIRKERYEAKGYKDLAHYNYNAHNQYLEVLATYGIIGGLIFLGILLFPLLRRNKHELLIPFLLIVSVTFLTESILVRQQGILFFMFFYVLYTHKRHINSSKDYSK